MTGSTNFVDFDFGTNYIVAFDPYYKKFVTGGVIGGEVHHLLFTPSFTLNDVAIDATTGIVYAVNNAGGVYSVNQDGPDPTFLGSAGLGSQPAPAKYFLDVYDNTIYLGHSSDVYAIPKDQVGAPLDQFSVCNACMENVSRVLYVVDEFAKAGDTDLDFDVDITDFQNFVSNFDPTGILDRMWRDGDFDGNHIVDITDFHTLVDGLSPMGYDRQLNLGGNVQTPEPSAHILASLALGLVSVSFRLSKNG